MSCKGTKVTAEEIQKMWELYKQLGSYAAVGKQLRRNPDTVSRHIAKYEAALAAAKFVKEI